MTLDICWPIGIMFSLVGAMLAIFGFMTKASEEMYKRSLDININLWWGLVLLAFGGFMLLSAYKNARKEKSK
jgi:hypothetical protein